MKKPMTDDFVVFIISDIFICINICCANRDYVMLITQSRSTIVWKIGMYEHWTLFSSWNWWINCYTCNRCGLINIHRLGIILWENWQQFVNNIYCDFKQTSAGTVCMKPRNYQFMNIQIVQSCFSNPMLDDILNQIEG